MPYGSFVRIAENPTLLCRNRLRVCQSDNIEHYPVQFEVLGRIDPRDTHGTQPVRVILRDDPTDNQRHMAQPGVAHLGEGFFDQGQVTAGQDRQANDVRAFLLRRRDDLGRG